MLLILKYGVGFIDFFRIQEYFMWECRLCRRLLDDEDKMCWCCGGKRADVELVKEKKVEEDNIIDMSYRDENNWECKNCRRLLTNKDDECWSCGGKRADVESK